MSKDPSFLFYPADFIVGSVFMTYEQKGKYITLMCMQHQHGHLTQTQFDSVCGGDEAVREKFIRDENGNLYNQRLDYEIEKRKEIADKHRAVGSLGGRPKGSVKKPKENQMVSENKPNGFENKTKWVSETKPNQNQIENDYDYRNINNNIPTIEDINNYCLSINANVDVSKFYSYYDNRGWTVNGDPISDWKALVRGWSKRERKDVNKSASSFDTDEFFEAAMKNSYGG